MAKKALSGCCGSARGGSLCLPPRRRHSRALIMLVRANRALRHARLPAYAVARGWQCVARFASATAATAPPPPAPNAAASSVPPPTPGRSESLSRTLSASDASARDVSFRRGVAEMQRLHRAHLNSVADPHVQVVIDCHYDATRGHAKLAASLANQVLTCIGSNRRAERPVKLWATEWPTDLVGTCRWPRVHDRFMNDYASKAHATTSNHANQTGAHSHAAADASTHSSAAADAAAAPVLDTTAAPDRATIKSLFSSSQLPPLAQSILVGDSRFNNAHSPTSRDTREWTCEVDSQPVETLFQRDSVIYLTPDSPNILTEIDTERVYVIGGLVDKTVVKGVSYSRATLAGFATARLPVREYLGPVSKSTSLNIDTVFNIMLDCNQAQHEYKKQQQQQQPNSSTSLLPVPIPSDVLQSQWTTVLQRHIPSRYWRHNESRIGTRVRASSSSSITAAVNASSSPLRPPRPTRAGSTHLRRQEHKWVYQLQRTRLTAAITRGTTRDTTSTVGGC